MSIRQYNAAGGIVPSLSNSLFAVGRAATATRPLRQPQPRPQYSVPVAFGSLHSNHVLWRCPGMKASRQEKKDAMHSLRSFHGLPLQHIHAIQNLNEAVEDTHW